MKRMLLAAVSAFAATGAWAQAYPEKPVTIVVPFAAGGGTEFLARLLGQRLEQRLGKPFVIENVPGAPIRQDLLLCGSMFGLRTYRHRLFTIDPRLPILLTAPEHPKHVIRTSTKKRRRDFDAGMNISVTGDVGSYLGPACMGIDWMTGAELNEAIAELREQMDWGASVLDGFRKAAE